MTPKRKFRLLTYVFLAYLGCFVVPFIDLLSSDALAGMWLIVLVITHLGYLIILGSLVAGANKSVLAWVGLTFIGGPLGILASFLFVQPLAIREGWK